MTLCIVSGRAILQPQSPSSMSVSGVGCSRSVMTAGASKSASPAANVYAQALSTRVSLPGTKRVCTPLRMEKMTTSPGA